MNLNITIHDPLLEPFRSFILRRYEKRILKEVEFTHHTKRLSDCFNNHLYFGLHHLEDGSWVFREWAPSATAIYLLGESNEWQRRKEWRLKEIGQGIWELKLPPQAIWHKMEYKLWVEWPGGGGERIPAYARRVIQDDFTNRFTTQVWEPKEVYKWKNDSLPRQNHPLIYEVHIGMCMENKRVSTFNEFRAYVLPRIVELGYNMIQLMGIQEHPYYGSFGYQVSNFFAVSSRFGTPEDLKHLIDEAHSYGIGVIMDLVHSHAVRNESEGLGVLAGDEGQYFHAGMRGIHPLWDSRCFDYSKNEVLAFLLSNAKFWAEEFHFDGFRFDGVTSMLYWDHGLNRDFTAYKFYYDGNQDEDAMTYLTLVNKVLHEVNPELITIAEEMSGMPGLALPLEEGGMGFDFRMSMGVPDYWIKLIKEKKDEDWHVGELFYELTNKRFEEHTISYAESHDQAMVGDQTLFFRLVGREIYTGMHLFGANLIIERGMALHKMIRLITITTAGDGYLNFMGNEFGHPEWIDFPREGNQWSYQYARRQWSLADDLNLRFRFLQAFDKAMICLARQKEFFSAIPEPIVRDNESQILIFKRGVNLFVFNFSPEHSYVDYRLQVDAGKYMLVLHTDEKRFDGLQRLEEHQEYMTLHQRGGYILSLYIPSRTALVLEKK